MRIRRRETRCLADHAADIFHTATHNALHMVMVVANPGLPSRAGGVWQAYFAHQLRRLQMLQHDVCPLRGESFPLMAIHGLDDFAGGAVRVGVQCGKHGKALGSDPHMRLMELIAPRMR